MIVALVTFLFPIIISVVLVIFRKEPEAGICLSIAIAALGVYFIINYM